MPGAPAEALAWALDNSRIIVTDVALAELVDVLNRAKFDRYLSAPRRQEVVGRILDAAIRVEVTRRIVACRDPADDKFLEAAVNGGADVIVTGDDDLLALHPFEDVAILSPADFLERVAGDG